MHKKQDIALYRQREIAAPKAKRVKFSDAVEEVSNPTEINEDETTNSNAAARSLLEEEYDQEMCAILANITSSMVSDTFAKLRQKVHTWPPIRDMSEDDGMKAVQDMILEACRVCLGRMDLSRHSAAQIEATYCLATQQIQSLLRDWKREFAQSPRQEADEATQTWKDESSLDAWLESE